MDHRSGYGVDKKATLPQEDEEELQGLLVEEEEGEKQTLNRAQLRSEEDYILKPKWYSEQPKPTTREYHWTISEHELNPDGVYRPVMLINGINATSIHWHGLYQNGTNWMDGTVGVTQCPIAPGHSFTYRFNVSGQSGTYWYHSHMSMQASDGLVGPLVIHSSPNQNLQKAPYGQDRVVLVSDHYYDLSSSLLMQYLSPGNENDEPVPPSALINGRNTRDCSKLPSRTCSSTNTSRALFEFSPHHNTRLRIINVGAFAEFQIQIDEHEFLLSEVDGTDVWPQPIHRLNISPAQRYSIIVVPPKPHKDLYWMRARMVTHCFAYENPELQEEVWGVVSYGARGTSVAYTPESKDWPDIIEVECRDLNTSALEPVEVKPAPKTADDVIYLRSSFQIRDWRLSRGYLNDSSFRPNVTSPILNRFIDASAHDADVEHVASGSELSSGINTALFDASHDLVYQTPSFRTLDILIQNLDDGTHPFHLHGYKFFVLAQGPGYAPLSLLSRPPQSPSPTPTPALNLHNPLRRDTVSVAAYSWTLLRFVANNPGVWALHCHIGWHAEAGLAMQVLVGPDVVSGWDVPAEFKRLCAAEGVERGKAEGDERWGGRWKR
ncbi:multicopper oxidase [Massariosphaeria phaeospora]|uniref:Multicopper oxidase n=1 Tax=Massariosphaeria phaeospora TaxID=100035 RepID=A0A7C8ME72_9PLEO|nr:multicopper oxidase [Massariosphaeria phaeospora]